MMITSRTKVALLCAVIMMLSVERSSAAQVILGVASEATSMDPHYHNLGSNIQVSKHIFDSLIDQDAQQRLIPALATSWKLLDATTWEFRLREGVVFHNNIPFTARDVAFTFRRVQNVPGSPSSFSPFVRQIESVRIIDDHTFHLKTKNPYMLLPNDLSNVFIVSESRGEGASTADYNSGKAAVGTGPFMFGSYAPGDRIRLTKSPTYWGKPVEWDQVTHRELRRCLQVMLIWLSRCRHRLYPRLNRIGE